MIGTHVDRKRKLNLITSNENEQKKRKRDAPTATPEVSPKNNDISDNNCTQQVHVVDIEAENKTNKQELAWILNSPVCFGSIPDTTSSSTTSSSSSNIFVQRPLLCPCKQQQQQTKYLKGYFSAKVSTSSENSRSSAKNNTNLHPCCHAVCSDVALCHLLCLAGYDKEDVANMERNSDIFEEIMSLIGSIKAQLMKHTLLTKSSAMQLSKIAT